LDPRLEKDLAGRMILELHKLQGETGAGKSGGDQVERHLTRI